MTSNNNSTRRNWIPAIVTLLIGALVTIGATYYTIYQSQKQAIEAEQERYKKVKDNIVSIVEEHIVNKKSIDFNRLQRIIDIQQKEENLNTALPISDIFSQAEYNILNSRHLDIQKKEEYELFLNQVYEKTIPASTYDYTKFRYPKLLSSLNIEIANNNIQEANKILLTIIDKYETDLKSTEIQSSKEEESFINLILDKPTTLIIVTLTYIAISFSILTFYRNRLKRRKLYIEKRKRLEKELEGLNKELDLQSEHYFKAKDEEHKEMYKNRIMLIQKEIDFVNKEITTANNA